MTASGDDMDAQEIIVKMGQRYGNCMSYSDAGSVFRWDHGTSKQKAEFTFRTYFSAPSRFRFEWKEDDKLSIVWCDGKTAYSSYSFCDEMEICDSLELAIAGATGVSMGSAFEIPALLVPTMQEHSHHLLTIRNAEFEVDTNSMDDCYCIVGSVNHSKTWLWVSRKDFSLKIIRDETRATAEECRRMMEETSVLHDEPFEEAAYFVDIHHYTEIQYEHIAFDEAIDPSVFVYEP
jgi:hypothetical protein